MRFSRSSFLKLDQKVLYAMMFLNVTILILLFMILWPFFVVPSGLSITLPRAVTQEAFVSKRFDVTVLEDGSIFLGSVSKTLKELKLFLGASSTEDSEVLIKADQRVSLGTLVAIWDTFREAGVSVIHIATNS